MQVWNKEKAEKELLEAFEKNSETKLLKVLKENSFLFYELYHRKNGIQPNFCEVSFGGKYKCDFAWLNDNSDGPEWTLVEVEKPKMKILNMNKKITAQINSAIEQVKSWQRYFNENPNDKRRIFGAVAKFRYILVAGDIESWSNEEAMKWRVQNNSTTNIEVRTSNVFKRALNILNNQPDDLWSFSENPKSLQFSKLEHYCKNNDYLLKMRITF